MALNVYASADPSFAFSTEGTFTNPIALSFDGVAGGVLIKKYYLRNDNNTRYYNNITLSGFVESGQDITDGTNGFSWKLIKGSDKPLDQEWALVADGAALIMEQIGSFGAGDSVTYYPFWIRIQVPDGVAAQAFENVKLRISYTENIA